MKTKSLIFWKSPLIAFALLVSASLALSAAAEKKEAAPQTTQKGFETAQQAADALIQAAEAFDVAVLKEILGPGSEDIVASEDAVQDKSRAAEFASKAKEKHAVEADAKNANSFTLVIGNEDWPLPIPIVKRKDKWYFDTKAGREEILLRRIGANELDVIEICLGYVDAQKEYAEQKHDGSTVNQFAQRIVSTPGKQDGLAWKNPDGTWGGPVGETVAEALEQGYTDKSKPFHGYFFKVLKGQGPAAPLGEIDFLVGGAMIGGFALAAAPAEYGVTGVQTFIISHNGIVYQKDLGPDTLKEFKSMERYNPDKTWLVTEDAW